VKRQCHGGGLMVRGMLMPSGLIAVKVLSGKQITVKYVHTSKTFCVPIMNLNMALKIWLVQDNYSIYVAKFAKSYFETQNFEVNLLILI